MGTFLMDTDLKTDSMQNTQAETPHPIRKVDDNRQFVDFLIGNEEFAINLFHTREVITPAEITPLPSAPPYITGIMDLRGQITTIIDLKKMMNITSDSRGKKRSRIIILDREISEKPVGILVDDVFSVSTFTPKEIDRSSDDHTHNSRNILGIIRKKGKEGGLEGQGLILWLDIQRMITKIKNDL